eukprot:COSAG02_NODE_48724_length_331_cov_2.431034_1_plen_50_part_01
MRMRQLAAHARRDNLIEPTTSHATAKQQQVQHAAQPARFGADADTVALYL